MAQGRIIVLSIMTSAGVLPTAALALMTTLSLVLSWSSSAGAESFTSLAFLPSQNRNGIIPPSASFPSSLHYSNPGCSRSGIHSQQWSKPTLPSPFGYPNMKKNNPRTICHYTDEWLDAEIEHAAFNIPRRHRHNSQSSRQRRRHRPGGHDFQSNYHAPKNNSSPRVSHFLRQLFLPIIQFYLHFKEAIRTKLERSTVYVLECENNKYYVGSTTNRKRRYHQHMHQRGSKWTKIYRPTSIVKEYRRIPSVYLLGMESKVTAQTMLRYGVNNVRGSMFCSVRNYHMGDIDALTKFIGHYNDLEYGRVYSKLCRVLPPPPSSSQLAMEGVERGGGRRRGKPWRKNITGGVDIVASSHDYDDDEEGGQVESVTRLDP